MQVKDYFCIHCNRTLVFQAGERCQMYSDVSSYCKNLICFWFRSTHKRVLNQIPVDLCWSHCHILAKDVWIVRLALQPECSPSPGVHLYKVHGNKSNSGWVIWVMALSLALTNTVVTVSTSVGVGLWTDLCLLDGVTHVQNTLTNLCRCLVQIEMKLQLEDGPEGGKQPLHFTPLVFISPSARGRILSTWQQMQSQNLEREVPPDRCRFPVAMSTKNKIPSTYFVLGW